MDKLNKQKTACYCFSAWLLSLRWGASEAWGLTAEAEKVVWHK
ncbi:hypothetical protein PSE_4494 [Pseudovibrio sp. FO-BEG1]|nr:hypothetical protein PSE_4494 [Pseudovibrio sp. FO-BEG1]